MNENLHNEDEYFKSAYKQSEEAPSPEVWNKINAALDKRDAAYYRKKFTYWRLVACLVILLFSSAVIYYAFVRSSEDEKDIAIHNNTNADKQMLPVENTSADSKKAGSKMYVDSIKTYPLNNEIAFAPLHTDEHQNNSNHPYHPFKNREQNTEPVNHSPIMQQMHNKQQLPGFTIDSLKQFQQSGQPSLPVQFEESEKQSVKNKSITGSIVNDSFVRSSPYELKQETVTSSVKEDTAFAMQDTIIAKQDYAMRKHAYKKKNKAAFTQYWTITPFASADFTHYRLDNDATDDNNGSNPEDKADIREREKHEFSFSAGVMAKLQLSKKLGVKTSAIYSNIAIGIQPQTLYASANGSRGVSYKFITSSGYAYVNPNSGIAPVAGDSISSYIAQHHLQYLQIPAMLSYTLLSKKHFYVDAAAGVSTNFLLSTTVETELDDNNNKQTISIHKLHGLRALYFSYVADANLHFYINRHIRFTLIPSFKYAIDPINKSNVVKTYPYSFGIGAGITYRL